MPITAKTLLVLMFLGTNVLAQDVGSWWMYFGSHKFTDRFGVWTELQYRDYGFFEQADQLLLRTGLEYYLKPGKTLTAGYGFIPDWPPGPESPVLEHRLWEQYNLVHRVSRWELHHRFRLEQRWIEAAYKNRIRYRFMANYPIGKPIMGSKTWFMAFYDEIMMGFGNEDENALEFDQNRLYGALGFRFVPGFEMQSGYLFQTGRSGETNQRFQLALFYNLDFR